MTAGAEIATDFIAGLVLRIWPQAACRWFGHHTWVGEPGGARHAGSDRPIHDRCKFCGIGC
jgi:hypothetical protein